MSRQKKFNVDDSHWFEVEHINGYAVFMGHLSRAVREIGFLVVAWSTVVLLGGFVSALERKDFWSVAGITLIQTTGVFDAFRKEKLRNVWHASKGFSVRTLFSNETTPSPQQTGSSRSAFPASSPFHMLLAAAKVSIQAVVFTTILLPLAAIYLLGIYISSGISLWRLSQRDYGVKRRDATAVADPAGDNSANLIPSLDILYSLALLQGVLFCYKTLFSLGEKKALKKVLTEYRLDDDDDDDTLHQLTQDYLDETKAGCEEDLSFATGRNLITYAVELTESRSPGSFVSGVTILDSLMELKQQDQLSSSSSSSSHTRDRMLSEQKALVKQLIGPASPSQALHRMIRTLDSRSPYDGEVRMRAARMVTFFAGDVRLEQFPGGIQCIASLLTMRERDQNELLLFLQGLRILQALAADEDNCRLMRNAGVMSTAQGLLSKIALPVEGSDPPHHCSQHGEMAQSLLQLISRLGSSAPRETDTV